MPWAALVTELFRWLKFLATGHRQFARCEAEREVLTGEIENLKRQVCRATVVCDAHGIIVEWGTGNTAFLRWSKEAMLGQTVLKMVPTKYRPRHLAGFAAFVEAVRKSTEPLAPRIIECPVVTSQGEQIPVQMTITGWRDETGQILVGSEIRTQ